MKKFVLLIMACVGTSIFAQTNARQIAPAAVDQLKTLLNNPTMVRPVTVAPLGKNWFAMEMDTHVFTDQINVQQVAAILLDVNNQEKYFDGKKSKLSGKVVSVEAGRTIADFISISIAPLGIKIRTPYQVSVIINENTDTVFSLEMIQLPANSDSNHEIKKFYAQRYAESVTIDGKTYTYIRIHTVNEVNASILPGAKGVLENNSGPANIEAVEMLIAAAKGK